MEDGREESVQSKNFSRPSRRRVCTETIPRNARLPKCQQIDPVGGDKNQQPMKYESSKQCLETDREVHKTLVSE